MEQIISLPAISQMMLVFYKENQMFMDLFSGLTVKQAFLLLAWMAPVTAAYTQNLHHQGWFQVVQKVEF
mgnify:CR=1 FL=1